MQWSAKLRTEQNRTEQNRTEQNRTEQANCALTTEQGYKAYSVG